MVDFRLRRKKKDFSILLKKFRKDYITKIKTNDKIIIHLFFNYLRDSSKSGSILGRYL